MFKWLARLTVAKKVYDWYKGRKASKNESDRNNLRA